MITLNDNDFESFVTTTPGLIVVDVMASWCPPCRMLAPILDELAVLNPDVVFCKMDIDAAPEMTARLRISGVPAMFFYKNGQLVHKMVGLQAKPKLQQLLDQLK